MRVAVCNRKFGKSSIIAVRVDFTKNIEKNSPCFFTNKGYKQTCLYFLYHSPILLFEREICNIRIAYYAKYYGKGSRIVALLYKQSMML